SSERSAESALGAMHDVVGQYAGHCLLEDRLTGAAALLERRWDAGSEANQVEVQERHAHFDAGRHTHLVRVVEVVVGEKVRGLEKQHPLQAIVLQRNASEARD